MRTRRMLATAVAAVLMVGVMALPAVGQGEEEGPGNNMSYPLLFAEGIGVSGYDIEDDDGLRGPEENLVSSTHYVIDGVPYDLYLQNTENEWRGYTADKRDKVGDLGALIKWGDNLMSHTFAAGRKIRVEQQLWRTLGAPQTSYEMILAEGEKLNEVWGTTGTIVPTADGFVFSAVPQLTIWKIKADGTRVKPPIFRGQAYEKFVTEGPSSYGVEVTKGGQVTYGTQFQPSKAGTYRLVFKLLPEVAYTLTPEEGDPVDMTVERHTKLLGVAFSTEEEGEDPKYIPFLKDKYTSILEIEVK